MTLSKINSLVISLIILVASLFFLTMFITAAVSPSGTQLRFSIFGIYTGLQTVNAAATSTSSGMLFVVVIFIFGMIDISFYLLEQSALIDSSKIVAYKDKNIWWLLSSYLMFKETIGAALAAIIFLIIIAVCVSILVSIFILNHISLGMPAVMIVVAMAAYPLVRMIVKKIFSNLDKWSEKFKPTYVLTANGVDIDLKIAGLNKEQRTAHIEFSELDEVKSLTFFEAEAYMKSLGPNVEQWLKSVKSTWNWGKERPEVFLAPQSNTKNVLFKGSKIHYLLAFAGDNVGDLLLAFENSKKG